MEAYINEITIYLQALAPTIIGILTTVMTIVGVGVNAKRKYDRIMLPRINESCYKLDKHDESLKLEIAKLRNEILQLRGRPPEVIETDREV